MTSRAGVPTVVARVGDDKSFDRLLNSIGCGDGCLRKLGSLPGTQELVTRYSELEHGAAYEPAPPVASSSSKESLPSVEGTLWIVVPASSSHDGQQQPHRKQFTGLTQPQLNHLLKLYDASGLLPSSALLSSPAVADELFWIQDLRSATEYVLVCKNALPLQAQVRA